MEYIEFVPRAVIDLEGSCLDSTWLSFTSQSLELLGAQKLCV